MTKIFISDKLSESVVEYLEKKGFEVTFDPGHTEDELAQMIPEYDAILVRSATQVTQKIIEAGERLKLIGRAGSGVDNIDLKAASAKGILVINAPFGNLTSVAELVFGHFFNLSRRITLAHSKLKDGRWGKKEISKVSHEIDGKTLGIIGLGKIGQLVAARAKGFNLKIIAFDPGITPEIAAEQGVRLVTFAELLENSDLITIHVPLIPPTKHLISTEQFKKMKKTALLVHAARGGIIDDQALYQALESGEIAGAGLDVFESEPLDKENPFLKLDNVSLTPHLGGDTIEAQSKVGLELAEQIASALKGEMVPHIVNFPWKPKNPFPEQKKFIDLAEKLGKFLGQYSSKNIDAIIIETRGDLAKYDTKILSISVLKGLLAHLSGVGEVNLLNAQKVAEEKGIKVNEKKEDKQENYSNELRVFVKTSGVEIEARGAISESKPHIFYLDGLELNFSPEGYLLISEHKDVPGTLAASTSVLAEQGINVAGMHLGRDSIGGRAIMVLNIDGLVSDDVLKTLNALENFSRVKLIEV